MFTENFGKRILAENIVGIRNLEKSLNENHSKSKNRIILEGVSSSYKDEKGIYVPKDHIRGYQIINANHIDFVFGPEDLIYSEKGLTSYKEFSVLWGMRGLHHALIGDIKVPGNYTPNFNKNNLEPERMKKEFELISYLDKQLKKNFMSFHNPRTDSLDAKKEFASLFKGIKMPKINKLLINNKKQSNSNTSHAVYLGKSSKNYS